MPEINSQLPARKRKLTRRLCRDFVSLVEASRLSGSFRLSARRALALSGKTQAFPRSLRCKVNFKLHSERTGVVYTRCTSLARPWMGYAPKSQLRKSNNQLKSTVFPPRRRKHCPRDGRCAMIRCVNYIGENPIR